MKYLLGILLLLSLLLSACQVPQTPTAATQPSSQPSEYTDPPCFVDLQCIVDTTEDNALRKEAQEIIQTLMQTREPQFSRICLSRSQELLRKEPRCSQGN